MKIEIDTDSPDYDLRMKAAKRTATWELGDPSWASTIVGAFLYPEQTLEALELEIKEMEL